MWQPNCSLLLLLLCTRETAIPRPLDSWPSLTFFLTTARSGTATAVCSAEHRLLHSFKLLLNSTSCKAPFQRRQLIKISWARKKLATALTAHVSASHGRGRLRRRTRRTDGQRSSSYWTYTSSDHYRSLPSRYVRSKAIIDYIMNVVN